MAAIIVLLILWVTFGGLKQFGDNKPDSMEETTRQRLKGYEGTQYYKEQIEAARQTDNFGK